MRHLGSHTDSIAQSFAQRTQSSVMMSSRTSMVHQSQQGHDAAQQIAQFRLEIQKRYIMSVANKYYSFPLKQISFDNPFDDKQLTDLIGIQVLCLHDKIEEEGNKKDNNDDRQNIVRLERSMDVKKEKLMDVGVILKQIRSDRQKFSQILQLINNRKNMHNEDKHSKSKQKRLPYKYGVIKQQNEQVIRKRLMTQPNDKPSGFIIKKK